LVPENPPERRRILPRKAAGAQIAQSQNGEAVTINNKAALVKKCRYCNEYKLNPLTSSEWRESLVPAAA